MWYGYPGWYGPGWGGYGAFPGAFLGGFAGGFTGAALGRWAFGPWLY